MAIPMKCPECNTSMEETEAEVFKTDIKVKTYQCPVCNYFDFDDNSIFAAIADMKRREQKCKD